MTTRTTLATQALSRTDDLPLGRRMDHDGRMHGKVGSLPEKSWQRLEKLEAVVDKGLDAWLKVGNALVAIKRQKLWRIDSRTFNAYCKKRFNITSRRAYQLIGAAEVVADLGTIVHNVEVVQSPDPPVTKFNVEVVPANESQARPLTRLEPAERQSAWDKAVETAPNGKVTAKHVEQVVAERIPESAPKRVDRKEYPPCTAKQFADLAIGQLDQIKPDDEERLQAFDQVEEWIKARRDECP